MGGSGDDSKGEEEDANTNDANSWETNKPTNTPQLPFLLPTLPNFLSNLSYQHPTSIPVHPINTATDMNDLPSSLLEEIISLLDPSERRLSSYYTVSMQLRFAVERHTFRYIELKSTDLERFEEIFWDHRRREALARIDYKIILPSYSDKDLNDEAFIEAVHAIFRILHSWEQSHRATILNWIRGCPIKLDLSVYSPTDRPYQSEDKQQEREKLIMWQLEDKDKKFPSLRKLRRYGT
jgi:hypothetical protein